MDLIGFAVGTRPPGVSHIFSTDVNNYYAEGSRQQGTAAGDIYPVDLLDTGYVFILYIRNVGNNAFPDKINPRVPVNDDQCFFGITPCNVTYCGLIQPGHSRER